MANQNKLMLALLAVIALTAAGCIIGTTDQTNSNAALPVEPINNETNQNLGGNEGNMVGNDADEHGCIGSAGYTWCEAKNKCVRLWEEDCSSYTKQAVTKILADKYNKELSEVTVTVTKFDDTHAAGGVKFGAGGTGEGGLFLAARVDNVWEVVYDGNGAVDCDKMRNDYGFSDELLKNFCDPLGAKTKP